MKGEVTCVKKTVYTWEEQLFDSTTLVFPQSSRSIHHTLHTTAAINFNCINFYFHMKSLSQSQSTRSVVTFVCLWKVIRQKFEHRC